MLAYYARTRAESLIELVRSRGSLLGSRLINVDVKSTRNIENGLLSLIIVDVKCTRNIENGFTPFDYCGCHVY